MHLKSEIPRVVTHHQTCHFLVGQSWNSVAVLAVGLAGLLSDDVLPSVKELRASWTVGDYQIRLIRLHRLEFFIGVRLRIATVCLHEILTESESAAMTALRVIDNFATPSLNHSNEHVRIFRATEAFRWEHLRIVASDMLNALQRLAGLDIHERELHLFGNIKPEFIYKVTCMSEIFRLCELFLA